MTSTSRTATRSGCSSRSASGATLVGEDIAWLIQPYMALLAALLTLSIGQLLKPLLERAWLRAVVAFLAAQSALLLGYALWGGVKEVAAAMLVALVAALVVDGIAPREGRRARSPPERSLQPARGHSPVKAASVIPAAVASAALLGVLSPGGAIWILVPLGAAFVLLLRQRGTRPSAPQPPSSPYLPSSPSPSSPAAASSHPPPHRSPTTAPRATWSRRSTRCRSRASGSRVTSGSRPIRSSPHTC